jgi:hypothetical protein
LAVGAAVTVLAGAGVFDVVVAAATGVLPTGITKTCPTLIRVEVKPFAA